MSELARNYAKAATRMVEAVGTEVRGLGEEENVRSTLALMLLRIKETDRRLCDRMTYASCECEQNDTNS